jgi:UDP-N-acetylmuramoyl-tripeptide--D-alanyl-D-alanine ligase
VITAVSAVVLTAAMVAEATGGRVAAGPAERAFLGVSTDTRAMTPGSLFIALRGDRFDAHAFLDRAVAAGAAGVLVSAVPAIALTGVTTVVVQDTLRALQDLARAVRRRSGTRVIAITGSAGKTTTKEVAAAMLAVRYRVFRNRGNLNNHVGLPLSLLELTDGPDLAVVELGMNHAGEIRTLVRIAEPDVRVWTNVGDAHIGHFGSRAAIADAKAEILEGASLDTVVVSNADDPLVAERAGRSPARHLTFGRSPGSTVRATTIQDRGFAGTTADVETPSGPLHLDVPLAGQAQLMNVLAAVCVCQQFGLSSSEIEDRVRTLEPVARRGALHDLSNGVRLVDDSYNASPDAVQAMLAALAVTPVSGRRIAVLGEMLELGAESRALHETCGRAAALAGVQQLVVIGGESADGLVEGARQGGLPAAGIHRFPDSPSAAAAVRAIVRPGDLVLVKASRGTRADIVADQLMASA